MLSQDSLERATSQAGITVPPTFLEETDSTNRVALELAEAGAEDWTVIAADQQTAGRGRLGRSWASAPGKALLLSVILRPAVEPPRAALLSLLAGWAMVTACPSLPAGAVRAKWPNDLVVGERKLGGILSELNAEGDRVRHVIIGVGVNVSMRPEDFPEEVRGSATSLALEGAPADHADLLRRFLVAFRGAFPRGDAAWDGVIERYRGVCATLGRMVRATTTLGRTVEGEATAISPAGGLVVRDRAGGEHAVAFGEVAHLD
jgi:BirA family transcriptional regulator, biotin operon repressor / biotin---[acetyl-CoA-carboxylase] ligase